MSFFRKRGRSKTDHEDDTVIKMKCFSELLQMIQRVSETRILDKDPFRNKVSNTVGKDVLENLERNGIRSLSDYTGQEILAAIMIKLDRSPPIMSSEVRKRLVQIHGTSHSNDVVRRFRDFFKTSKSDPLSMTVLWSVCSLISQTDENFRKRMSKSLCIPNRSKYTNTLMKIHNNRSPIWHAHLFWKRHVRYARICQHEDLQCNIGNLGRTS